MIIQLALAVLGATSISLPGGPPAGMDYIAYDAANHRVWVPAGNTGNVDVIDTATGKLTPIGGFATKPSTRPNRPKMGPSSATVAEGTVWVGNRGDNSVCGFDARTLAKKGCVSLKQMPDGLQYVAATHEVWVTTPEDETLTVIDVSGKTPLVQSAIKVPGAPEGYAVDGARGIFYTNLEDKDQTVAIDVKTRKLLWTRASGCGGDGPRGLAFDAIRNLLIVGCTDGAVTQDLAHDSKVLGRIKTGKGVDNIDYLPAKRTLYIASREDGMLTIASVGESGVLKSIATSATVKGARNAVVDSNGTAYVTDGAGGNIIVVKESGAATVK